LGDYPFLGINKGKIAVGITVLTFGIRLLGSWYCDGAVEKSKDG